MCIRDSIQENQRLLDESNTEFTRDSNRYALSVAYYENEDYAIASRILAPLLEKEPNRISYVVTQAEILTEQNESGQAIEFLTRHLEINLITTH